MSDKHRKTSYTPLERGLAILGIVLLLGMYVITFILAFVRTENAFSWLMASVICTVFIPIMLHFLILMIQNRRKGYDHKEDED